MVEGGSTTTRRRYVSPVRTEQLAETRRRVIDAYLELVREGGVEDVSMAAIAASAGISVRTLYRHFPTRAELALAVAQSAGMAAVVEDPPADARALADAVPAQFRAMARHEPLFRALHGSAEGRRTNAGARDVRRVPVLAALADVEPALDPGDHRKLAALVQLLSSSVALFHLRDHWDLSTAAAADAAGWAIEVLVAAAVAEEGVGRARH